MTDAWNRRVENIAVLDDQLPPQNQGFVSDAQLKKMIRQAMGANPTSCPKGIERDRLLEVACELNLVSAEDAEKSAPRKTGSPKSWKTRVDQAKPRREPMFDGDEFVTDSQLKSALEEYLEVSSPERISRGDMLNQALTLNLVSKEQANIPAPVKVTTIALKNMWDAYKKEYKEENEKLTKREELIEALVRVGKLSKAEAEAKGVRQDRAEAMQIARVSNQVTRCTRVVSLLKDLPNAEAIQATLIRISDDASRLFYQRSFLVWLHLARLIRKGLPLPDMKGDQLDRFVRQVYTFQTVGSNLKDEELKKTFDNNKKLFPILPRPEHVNIVTHAANAYGGAMRRHFANIDTVKQRIKRYASAKLFGVAPVEEKGEEDSDQNQQLVMIGLDLNPEVGDKPLYNIVSALECKGFDVSAMHPRQREVLKEIRTLLELPEGTELDTNWLRTNIHASIRFSFSTVNVLDGLREQAEKVQKDIERQFPDENNCPKLKKGITTGLSFVPLNALKRRFVTIDATDMAKVLKLPSSENTLVAQIVREMLMPNVKKIFGEKMAHHPDDVTKSGDAWYMTGTFDTDGYSIHPHFQRHKKAAEILKEPKVIPSKIETVPKLLLLVDPGRVNLMTVTAMVDGKVLMRIHKKRSCPLKFTFTTRHYYNLAGMTKRKIIRERREKKDTKGKELRTQQSATSLRTGNYKKIKAYIKASMDHAVASDEKWARALKKSAATERWRRQSIKDGVLLKWFYKVKKSIGSLTGLYDATVVWGCKVKSTGVGNLSAPTERSAKLAERVLGWKVVRGDEYKTSALSFVAPHEKNIAPRFRGVQFVKYRCLKRYETAGNRVRGGWVATLSAKHAIRRIEKGKILRLMDEQGSKKPKVKTRWKYEGHSQDSAQVKADKKQERQEGGFTCRYVRGLRVFIQDQATTKFVDRDVNGSINIGMLWMSDNIEGRSRPEVFVRSTPSIK